VSVLLPGFFPTNIDADLRGPDSARKMTRAMMDRSDVTADDVARRALTETARDRIHILLSDWQSQIVWHFQRLLPGTYVQQLPRREAEIRTRLSG
jgi:short-subunit dehydrogenase